MQQYYIDNTLSLNDVRNLKLDDFSPDTCIEILDENGYTLGLTRASEFGISIAYFYSIGRKLSYRVNEEKYIVELTVDFEKNGYTYSRHSSLLDAFKTFAKLTINNPDFIKIAYLFVFQLKDNEIRNYGKYIELIEIDNLNPVK